MRRQPTLAEILSDDTGKIRAEVADLLMEPNNQRLRPVRQARPQPRPQQRPFRIGWIVIVLAILLVVIISKAFNGSKNYNMETTRMQATENSSQFPVAPPAKVMAVRKGMVIGDNVNVRSQPNLQGEIIRKANQDEILQVISFRNGWYEVVLLNERSGYVFGAYLIPQNFDVYPYRVVTTNNQTKLLVKEEGNLSHYLAIMPDGKTTWMRKEDVAIINK
jgi:uncharacterized protein YgiM (DUF1202 family)